MKSLKEKLAYYLSLPYTVEIKKEEDGTFFGRIVELEGCMTEGDTLEELVENLLDAMICWLTVAIEDGMEIPEPQKANNSNELLEKSLTNLSKATGMPKENFEKLFEHISNIVKDIK